ncbi:ABC transporter ATP-binding protein [Paenibacillus flagellatus]|uniref:ABC transporter ATP-binding protein n=1 Tax=Paenibacillus flagellatus TaxID=2211139 RepID=A0A2V5L2R9_9BACL|nr:ABC transporter ATP-binding protein [Paenibacillus flagellatus]PYI57026.1 ABC transporter ATP-binding protein [Paenibacillus flagellatus]
MDTTKHRAAIERLYTDRATIRRNVEYQAPNRATRQEVQTIYIDQPCRMSMRALAQNDQTEAQNDVRYEIKLFISPELEIRQGDVVTLTRGARNWTLTAGEPFPYTTHQEISLQRKGYA